MKKALIEFEIYEEKDTKTVCIDDMNIEETFIFMYKCFNRLCISRFGELKLISIIFFEDTQ